MIAIPSNVSIFVIHEPVSFACGIDGMRGHCVAMTKNDPIETGYFLFINKVLPTFLWVELKASAVK